MSLLVILEEAMPKLQDRQIDRQTDRQTDRECSWTYNKLVGDLGRGHAKAERQTDRERVQLDLQQACW